MVDQIKRTEMLAVTKNMVAVPGHKTKNVTDATIWIGCGLYVRVDTPTRSFVATTGKELENIMDELP